MLAAVQCDVVLVRDLQRGSVGRYAALRPRLTAARALLLHSSIARTAHAALALPPARPVPHGQTTSRASPTHRRERTNGADIVGGLCGRVAGVVSLAAGNDASPYLAAQALLQ